MFEACETPTVSGEGGLGSSTASGGGQRAEPSLSKRSTRSQVPEFLKALEHEPFVSKLGRARHKGARCLQRGDDNLYGITHRVNARSEREPPYATFAGVIVVVVVGNLDPQEDGTRCGAQRIDDDAEP